MFAAILGLFQTAPMISVPPAPPAPATRSYPRTSSVLVHPTGHRVVHKPYVVEVDASANGQPLWQGKLRVGHAGGASFHRTLTEAPPEACAVVNDGGYSGSSSARDSFRITINPVNSSNDGSRQMFSLEWQRPMEDCSQGVLTRSVELSGTLNLQPGETATLQGDGGLRLRLMRR